MLLLSIIAIGICHAASLALNANGSFDEHGVCQCSLTLPDTTFPADRMEILEIENSKLTASVQQQIIKIESYQVTLTEYLQKLKNLTIRVEHVEMGGSYTELDFELLKLEIKEMESLVVELKASINGSNILVETLLVEIRNISIMVDKLESYDKNNVLAVRREIASLRKRLEKCEKENIKPTPPSVDHRTCKHEGIVNISKPSVVQLNWKGFSYKTGGWGKDSNLGANQNTFWVALIELNYHYFSYLRLHANYDDLILYKNPRDYTVSGSGNGAGMILYNNSLYYNCYNSRDICKLKATENKVDRKTLPNAAFNNRFSYSSSVYQDIDMASDEEGLWVIYATEQSGGNIVIGKLNAETLALEKTWTTSQYKTGVTNAFMVCGVLYTIRALNTRREEIYYTYDTKTGREEYLHIPLDKMMEKVDSLSYNPNDGKLYMYTEGYEVTYDLTFKPRTGNLTPVYS